VPQVDQAACAQALREACQGRRSFAELREAGVLGALRARLPAPLARALERLAPERLTLPGGRTLRLTYRPGQPPEAASRLQDFFGMRAGPSVLDGRVPITLHLLAPNGRDVQVTSDLAGFWARHYPGVARELRRRYPRHPWPDDPLTARPPGPGRTRT
jgi:ATP-dependent helicase HrpB